MSSPDRAGAARDESASDDPRNDANTSSALTELLRHPALWRGRSAARIEALPTGYEALDAALPGGGWPRAGLVEILTPRTGVGELRLLAPLLARLGAEQPPRWTAWVAPPFEPYAPGLAACGIALERQLVVRTDTALWAMEQTLLSGACEAVLAWVRRAHPNSVRRLQLAAERGRSSGFLFRALRSAREPSPAMLRLLLSPAPGGVHVELLKSRGGARGTVELAWPAGIA